MCGHCPHELDREELCNLTGLKLNANAAELLNRSTAKGTVRHCQLYWSGRGTAPDWVFNSLVGEHWYETGEARVLVTTLTDDEFNLITLKKKVKIGKATGSQTGQKL